MSGIAPPVAGGKGIAVEGIVAADEVVGFRGIVVVVIVEATGEGVAGGLVFQGGAATGGAGAPGLHALVMSTGAEAIAVTGGVSDGEAGGVIGAVAPTC